MALTTRYVTNAGAGAADGTSLANAMSYATFTDYMVTGGSFTASPGDVFLLCGVSQSRTTTTDTWVNGGNATSPVVIRGCDSSGNTAYAGRTNGNGALITTNFASITYTTGRLNITGTFIIVESLNVTSAASAATLTNGTDSAIRSCRVTNSSTNAAAVGINSAVARGVVFDCDIELTGASGGGHALNAGNNSVRVIGNRIKGGPAIGVIATFSSIIIANTIFVSTGIGISMSSTTGAPTILFNTIVGGGSDGINIITGTTVLQCIVGNMITDNTGDGIDMVSTSNAAFAAYNRTRDNANGYANAGDWLTATKYGDVTTDTGGAPTDYVDAGTNDYRLIAASPATSAGIPAYASIGALQRDQTTSGGGTHAYAFIS